MRYTLPDGESILIRPITPKDRAAVEAGFAATSQQNRFLRFMRIVDHLTDSELNYLVDVDGVDHVALGAQADDGTGLGIARYIRDSRDPTLAEAAVMVVDEHHGRGIGTALVEALSNQALANGITGFTAYVLAENRAVIDMLKRAGALIEPDDSALKMIVGLPIKPELFAQSALRTALRRAAVGDYAIRSRD